MPPAIAACARADGWQMDGYAAEINSLTKHTARTGYQHVTATIRQDQKESIIPTTTNKHSTDQLKGTSGGNHHSRQKMISTVVGNPAQGGTAQERGSWLGPSPLGGFPAMGLRSIAQRSQTDTEAAKLPIIARKGAEGALARLARQQRG